MTRFFLVCLLLAGCSHRSVQRMQITPLTSAIRVGVRNELKYNIRLKYDSAVFTTSNGFCEQRENIILLQPSHLGKDTLYATCYKRGRIIQRDTAIFDVARLKVFPALSGSRIQKIPLKSMRLIGGMSFYMEMNDRHWEPFTVSAYRFTVIRSGEVIHSNVESTHKFGDQSTKFLEQLKAGDLLLFSEIKVRDDLAPLIEPWPAVFEIQ